MRDAMWSLEALNVYSVRTAQCVSCLLTKRVIRYDGPGEEVGAPLRIVEALIKHPGEPTCTTCLAFSTDMALPDARRIVARTQAGLEELTSCREHRSHAPPVSGFRRTCRRPRDVCKRPGPKTPPPSPLQRPATRY